MGTRFNYRFGRFCREHFAFICLVAFVARFSLACNTTIATVVYKVTPGYNLVKLIFNEIVSTILPFCVHALHKSIVKYNIKYISMEIILILHHMENRWLQNVVIVFLSIN